MEKSNRYIALIPDTYKYVRHDMGAFLGKSVTFLHHNEHSALFVNKSLDLSNSFGKSDSLAKNG